MVKNQQVRLLMNKLNQGNTMQAAAAVSGMDVETARKYRRLGQFPEQIKPEHTWRTRTDPFDDAWEELKEMLVLNPGLQAKTLFHWLQKKHPGKYHDGQLRTLQRKIKAWRVTEGPPREVYFEQVHRPGDLAESDFTDMTDLNVTIQGRPFEHMLYHFTLTYSNWEHASICFSESYESLSEGLQTALWQLGGVPKRHKTDRLSAAVNNLANPAEFTGRYEALLKHYGIQRTRPKPDVAGKSRLRKPGALRKFSWRDSAGGQLQPCRTLQGGGCDSSPASVRPAG
jgi:transposase